MNPSITIEEAERLFGDEIENFMAKIINNKKDAFVLRLGLFVDLHDNFPVEDKIENVKANLYVTARTWAINYINHKNLMDHAQTSQPGNV